MVISSKEQYESYLLQVAQLIDSNPAEGSEDFERLQLLSLAVDAYERSRFKFSTPTPDEALCFRMEEQGLKPHL